MKLFINCSLLLFALIQLSLANADVVNDKPYGIYNLIATKLNEQVSNELITQAQLCSEMWEKLESLVLPGKHGYSVGYQEIKKNSNEFIAVAEKLKADKQNCALQKEVYERYDSLWYIKKSNDDVPEINEDVTHDIVEFFNKKDAATLATIQNEFNAVLHDIYDQLPAAIGSFTQSLDDKEKDEHKELLQWCQQFLETEDEFTKLSIFSLLSSFAFKKDRVKGDHCKWNQSKYEEFMYKTLLYTMPMLKPSSNME